MFDRAFVGVLLAGGVFQMIYRKIYPDSFLITDALPQPGEEFRGKIETPLKGDPAECKVKLAFTRRRSRSSQAIWESEQVVHPVRGENGILLPMQFSIPAGVRKEIDQYCNWWLSARAKTLPVPFRASFKVEDSSRNPKASV